jgi:drug/metabolite transporter (DMT)-like permease
MSEATSVPDAWIQVAASAEAAEHEAGVVREGTRAPVPSASPAPPFTPGAAKGALIAGNFFVVLVSLPMVMPMPETSVSDWAILVYLGTAQVALAYRLLVRAVARVPALEASLLALFEPVLNPLWAFLLLGERPSAWAYAGAAILAGVTIARAAAGSRQVA